jgi:hypothetical protein
VFCFESIYFGMGRVFDFVCVRETERERIEGGKKGEVAITSYNNSGKAEEGGQKKLCSSFICSLKWRRFTTNKNGLHA